VNPAALSGRSGWAVGLAVADAGDIDVAERLASASVGLGRLGVGLRVSTRNVRDLLEDPALASSGLSVEDDQFALGAGLALSDAVAVGITTNFTQSTALGSRATGLGSSLGVQVRRAAFIAGATYGTQVAGVRWRTFSGSPSTTPPERRLALGISGRVALSRTVGSFFGAEVSRDDGAGREHWGRFMAGVGLWGGRAKLFGGADRELNGRAPSHLEIGAAVTVGPVELALGQRFSNDAVVRNTLQVGAVAVIGAHKRSN